MRNFSAKHAARIFYELFGLTYHHKIPGSIQSDNVG